jgi:hypothetical protein
MVALRVHFLGLWVVFKALCLRSEPIPNRGWIYEDLSKYITRRRAFNFYVVTKTIICKDMEIS